MTAYLVSKKQTISSGNSHIDMSVPVAEFYDGSELQLFMNAVDNSKYEVEEEDDGMLYGGEE